MRRKRLLGVELTARSLVGLLAVLSFLFAFFPGSAATSTAAMSETGVVCQLEPAVHDSVAGHWRCESSGRSATCSSHSACASIVIPTGWGLVAAPDSALWLVAATDDAVGHGPSVSTPPPIAFS